MENKDRIHPDEWIFHEYLDGECSDEARAEFEDHLAGCPECADRLEELMILFRRIEALPDLALDTDLTPAVLEAITGPVYSFPAIRWVMVGQILGAVAAVAVAWPLIRESVIRLGIASLGATLRVTLTDWTLTLMEHWSTFSKSVIAFWPEHKPLFEMGPRLGIPTAGLWLLAASALLAWLVGNRVVLGGLRNRVTPMNNGGEEN
jgi:hypothetical protein